MLAIWSLVPLPFLKPAWISGSSRFTYCWSLAWRILSITLLACEMSANCAIAWTFFGIAFLWDWNVNWPFPVLWPLLSFPYLLAYWVQHFHRVIFRIWNSSVGIPSPPLALFIVVLPKAHLTLPIKSICWLTIAINYLKLLGPWEVLDKLVVEWMHSLVLISLFLLWVLQLLLSVVLLLHQLMHDHVYYFLTGYSISSLRKSFVPYLPCLPTQHLAQCWEHKWNSATVYEK